MLAQEIRIRGEPTADPQKCRFVLEAEVLSRSPVNFTKKSDTAIDSRSQEAYADSDTYYCYFVLWGLTK